MTTTRREVDILIQDSRGNHIAIVEVKNIKDLSRAEAIELRHNLITYGFPYKAPFFLLLSQDGGFLWKDAQYEDIDLPPTYEFPMDEVVARYSNTKVHERIYGDVLVLLVLEWLMDLSVQQEISVQEPDKTLALSGFVGAIKNATILLGARL